MREQALGPFIQRTSWAFAVALVLPRSPPVTAERRHQEALLPGGRVVFLWVGRFFDRRLSGPNEARSAGHNAEIRLIFSA